RFVIDAATGQLSVAAGASFDFEQAGAHRITVRLTDAAGNTADVQLSIAVSNANDAPTGGVTLSGTAAMGQVLRA
ncbi:cadherin repeat domain-containing protein, partial [Azohydromonas lata]